MEPPAAAARPRRRRWTAPGALLSLGALPACRGGIASSIVPRRNEETHLGVVGDPPYAFGEEDAGVTDGDGEEGAAPPEPISDGGTKAEEEEAAPPEAEDEPPWTKAEDYEDGMAHAMGAEDREPQRGSNAAAESPEGGGEVVADGAENENTDAQEAAEEVDVQETAEGLLEEAEDQQQQQQQQEQQQKQQQQQQEDGVRQKEPQKQEEQQKEEDGQTSPKVASSASRNKMVHLSDGEALYPSSHRSAWTAHGSIGVVVFGLLVPSAISTALLRDLVPTYWIYLHVCINVMTFAMTFFAVGIAFATMNGMGSAGEGHLKELHHVAGLLLLMLVSFQTANGFLRPPREFEAEGEDYAAPGGARRGEGGMTARAFWRLVHAAAGLLAFALGTYQVTSGFRLFARRYASPDWGGVYLGYVGWLVALILGGKLLLMWTQKRDGPDGMELQMGWDGRGGKNGLGVYDPENDLTVARFETV